MKMPHWFIGLGVAVLVFIALMPLVPAPECTSYGSDVTGCSALARSVLQVRVNDGVLGMAIAVIAAGAAGLLAGAIARRSVARIPSD